MSRLQPVDYLDALVAALSLGRGGPVARTYVLNLLHALDLTTEESEAMLTLGLERGVLVVDGDEIRTTGRRLEV